MTSREGTARRAAWAVFLLFAAVLFLVAPAEASVPRSAGVTQVDPVALASLERPALGLASPTLEPSGFSLGEDLNVFDTTNTTNTTNGQGSLGLCGLETRRCALTYARNNPLKYVDPDGRQVAPSGSVLVVPVNVVYSKADWPTVGGAQLRATTEAGITYARQFNATMGIALTVNRFEGNISFPSATRAEGTVQTASGKVPLAGFIAANKGLTVVVSGDSIVSGQTQGTSSIIGVHSDSATFNDETAHALGNTNGVPVLGNTIADVRLDVQEGRFDLGLNPTTAFQTQQRQGAAQAGCEAHTQGCPVLRSVSP